MNRSFPLNSSAWIVDGFKCLKMAWFPVVHIPHNQAAGCDSMHKSMWTTRRNVGHLLFLHSLLKFTKVKYKLGELSIFHGVHELYHLSDIKAVNNDQVLVLWGKRKAKCPSCPEELWFLVLKTENRDFRLWWDSHAFKDDLKMTHF